ncbi:general substrate transporter [Phycomyces blakesleeanus]
MRHLKKKINYTEFSTKTKVILICLFLSLGGFLYGYNFGVLTGVLAMPQFLEDMEFNLMSQADQQRQGSLLISTMMAAAFVGSLAAGPLADIIGRKGLTLLGTTIFVFGDVLQVGADSIAMVYGGRVMTGTSVGMISVVVPLYQSEIAPKEMRGRLVSTIQLSIGLGMGLAYWIDYAGLKVQGSMSWRLPFGLQLIPAIIFFVGMLATPESPRYLVQKQQDRRAIEVLALIRGDGKRDHPDVLMEFTEIKQSITYERQHTSGDYWYLFKRGNDNNQRRLLLGMAVQIFQQLTGVNAIMLYAPMLFETTGASGGNATLFGLTIANGISGIINCVSAIPPLIIMDRWGRRPTLVMGSIICSMCLIVMSIISDGRGYTIAFMVTMYVYIFSYGCSWGPAGWAYPTELYSQGVRAKALGITSAASWIATFAVIQLSPFILDQVQWKFYTIYAVICAVLALVIYKYLPETMGKSLEEVDLIFTCDFNTYDHAVHHPQTAAEALERLEHMHNKQSHLFNFGTSGISNNLPPNAIRPDNTNNV